jgi:hypothetical protein
MKLEYFVCRLFVGFKIIPGERSSRLTPGDHHHHCDPHIRVDPRASPQDITASFGRKENKADLRAERIIGDVVDMTFGG